tara:strand:- start:1067 stop:1294 length:228 start_codon:yes stop_codon:yes gene_type:complete
VNKMNTTELSKLIYSKMENIKLNKRSVEGRLMYSLIVLNVKDLKDNIEQRVEDMLVKFQQGEYDKFIEVNQDESE